MSDDSDRRLLPAERWTDQELPLLDMDPEAAEAMRAALVNPNNRACDARAELIELAKDARITELAVEAAYSAGVRNSIERMLVHQMALAHKSAFRIGVSSKRHSRKLRRTMLRTFGRRVLPQQWRGSWALSSRAQPPCNAFAPTGSRRSWSSTCRSTMADKRSWPAR